MSYELVSPTGMDYSPVESPSAAPAPLQTAWDFEAGGSYQAQAHVDPSGNTSAQVAGEAHMSGDAWGHDFHGDVNGAAAVSHDGSGFHGAEHTGGHITVHEAHDQANHSAPTHATHDTHSNHDSGSHADHGGSHGGDHGGGL